MNAPEEFKDLHIMLTDIVESEENAEDAIQSLEYLRDEINEAIKILER